MKEQKMTLLQHFTELRRRVMWVLLFLTLAFGAGWFAAPYLQEFLAAPLLNAKAAAHADDIMLYTKLTDGLMIQFSLAGLFAIFATCPFFLYQAWAFIAPGLKRPERRLVGPMLIMSPILFLAGAAFAYYFLFPIIFAFFLEMNRGGALPTVFFPVITDYLSFVINMLKVFGVTFQLPLILVLLNRIGVLTRAAVVKSRRYAIVGFFVLAAILTPPDLLSMVLLALPLWALFEISILFMKKE
ncbi:MAG: twin-arginine translocase subunit TatC [Alphaproteobacteria bacterium]|nr:twin-arginine translocase subunit TatC [Alphaproteobacteria bacterium]